MDLTEIDWEMISSPGKKTLATLSISSPHSDFCIWNFFYITHKIVTSEASITALSNVVIIIKFLFFFIALQRIYCILHVYLIISLYFMYSFESKI